MSTGKSSRRIRLSALLGHCLADHLLGVQVCRRCDAVLKAFRLAARVALLGRLKTFLLEDFRTQRETTCGASLGAALLQATDHTAIRAFIPGSAAASAVVAKPMSAAVLQLARARPSPTVRASPSRVTLTRQRFGVTLAIPKAVAGAFLDLAIFALIARRTVTSTVPAMSMWFVAPLHTQRLCAVVARVARMTMASPCSLVTDTILTSAATRADRLIGQIRRTLQANQALWAHTSALITLATVLIARF